MRAQQQGKQPKQAIQQKQPSLQTQPKLQQVVKPPSPQTQQPKQQPKQQSPRTQQQKLMKLIQNASPEKRKMVVDFLHKWLTLDENEIMSSRYPEEPVMLTHNWGSPPPSTPFQKQKTGGQTPQSRQKQQQKKAP